MGERYKEDEFVGERWQRKKSWIGDEDVEKKGKF